jgi:hypothetical protein
MTDGDLWDELALGVALDSAFLQGGGPDVFHVLMDEVMP